MNISIYALHLGIGGVEKYITTLANILCEEHEVKIISTYKLSKKPAFYLDPKVEVEYLIKMYKPNKRELKAAIKRKKIFEILRQGIIALKIIYLKNSKNKNSIKKNKSDVIISTRIFHNKLISKYAPKKSIKITGEHNYHNENKKYIAEVISSCKGFDYFIPISKYLSDYYRKPMEKNGVNTKYIRFCVDNTPTHWKTKLNSNNLISVGRLSKEKGYNELIDVFDIVHKNNESAKLHIIGDGVEYDSLKDKVALKELDDYIIFHGFRDKEYIFKNLCECSLYLMTSYTESFGIVLLEAMKCGVPCLAFSSAKGAIEIIEDNKNGYLVEDRDKNKMAEYVCQLLENKDELARLSMGASQTANLYSYDNTKIAWLEFIDTLK